MPEGKQPWFDIPVYNDHAGLSVGDLLAHYVDPSQRFPRGAALTPEDCEALDLFDALAEDPSCGWTCSFQPGDMQFVHNHTMLHDRTAFEDWPEPERKRHLLRLWLAAPGARPLPPAYAERYGSVEIGNRGGIICPNTAARAARAGVIGGMMRSPGSGETKGELGCRIDNSGCLEAPLMLESDNRALRGVAEVAVVAVRPAKETGCY